MRTSSNSSFWAVAVLLSGAAALAAACGGSGGDNRASGGTGNTTGGTGATGGSTSGGGSTGIAGTSSSGGTAAMTCDSSKMCCPTASCACPYPAGDGTTDLITNVDGDMANAFKTAAVAKAAGRWDLSRDMSTGTLMPAGNPTLKPAMGGANGSMSAMHVTGANLTGWGAALSALMAGGCPFDASGYGGISFWAKGTSTVAEGTNKLLVLVGNPEYLPKPAGFCDGSAVPADPACYSRHRVTIDLTADWKQYIIAWSDLMPPSYYTTGPAFGANRVTDIVFNASGPFPAMTPAASFDFWVDEINFVPKGTMGNLGGGSGGASAGGTGGASAGGTGGTGGTGGAAGGTGGAASGGGGTGGT
jgi:hypothetical protein